MYIRRDKLQRRRWPWVLLVLVLTTGAVGGYLFVRTGRALSYVPLSYLPARFRSAPTPTPVVQSDADHMTAGDHALDDSRLDDALAEYQRALALNPRNAQALARSSRVLTLRRRNQQALEKARQAIDLSSNNAEAQAYLALALDWDNQAGDAIAPGLRATELAPAWADGYAYLAEAYADKGLWDQAQAAADKALSLDPTSFVVQRNYGYVLEVQGNYRRAIDSYRTAITLRPQMSYLYLDVARNLELLKDRPGALAQINRAITVDPRDPAALDALGLFYFEDQDYTTAAKQFGKATEVAPDYANGWGHLGWCLYANKNWEEAVDAYEKAISLGARSFDFYYQLGLSYALLEECDKARPWFQKALELQPGAQAVRDGLRMCPEKK